MAMSAMAPAGYRRLGARQVDQPSETRVELVRTNWHLRRIGSTGERARLPSRLQRPQRAGAVHDRTRSDGDNSRQNTLASWARRMRPEPGNQNGYGRTGCMGKEVCATGPERGACLHAGADLGCPSR